MTNKERFIDLLLSTKRDGVETLVASLENSDFFIAPASTRFHEAYEGGLCEHSLLVYDKLIGLVGKTGEFNLDTLIIVSLLHDICKTYYYKVDYRNAKNERGQWEKVPYYTVDDQLPYGHGEKSVMLINDAMKLTLEEMMAIRWHMGAYSGQQDWNTCSTAFDKFPLAMYLHFADMIATHDRERVF